MQQQKTNLTRKESKNIEQGLIRVCDTLFAIEEPDPEINVLADAFFAVMDMLRSARTSDGSIDVKMMYEGYEPDNVLLFQLLGAFETIFAGRSIVMEGEK